MAVSERLVTLQSADIRRPPPILYEKHYFGTYELVAFIDEAGDRELRDPANPIFALGGCACLGKDLEAAIRQPWLKVREAVVGASTRPVHMREISRRLPKRKEEVFKEFFSQATLKRFSFGVTDRTKFDLGLMPERPVLELSLEFILSSLATLMHGAQIEAVSVIFEDGPIVERLRPLWARRLLTRNDGSHIPVSWAAVSKEASEPSLEVADFIAHSTAGFLRTGRSPQTKFFGRYKAAFPDDQTIGIGYELNEAEVV